MIITLTREYFGDSLSTGTTVSQLADTLEDIGLTVADFDEPARTALHAMLSWQLPDFSKVPETSDLVLLVFSFGTNDSCKNGNDCPLGPGPTNEMLAATAARFVNKRQEEYRQKVRIIAQWEVAVALEKSHGLKATAVGTWGAYESTAEILELMLCEWKYIEQEAILIAHPDHLRRVMWTAQTSLAHYKSSHLRKPCALPNNNGKTTSASSCHATVRLEMAFGTD